MFQKCDASCINFLVVLNFTLTHVIPVTLTQTRTLGLIVCGISTFICRISTCLRSLNNKRVKDFELNIVKAVPDDRKDD